VREYEGLFILDTAGADSAPKVIDTVKALIVKAGGKVSAEQKMDRRQFSRVADKKHTGGFYVNLLFSLEPAVLDELKIAFKESGDVFRAQITRATASAEAAAA
tara:strand:+ start:9436 stop:9744 length:309 start_codon:yes stop_codon:yes gene_type:complete